MRLDPVGNYGPRGIKFGSRWRNNLGNAQNLTFRRVGMKIQQRGIWPKAQIFDVPPNAGIPDAFSEMFRKNRIFFNPNLWPIKIHQITQPSHPQPPFGPNRRFLTFRQKNGIQDAFSEMFRKNRKFFQPQLMTYQNPSNNITKPSAASVWPKSQLFDVPPNAGVLDPF